MAEQQGATYAAAGVDIAAGDAAVEAIKDVVASTARPEVLGGIGGFGGLFALDLARTPNPVLVSSTDGVGTKLEVARLADRFDTVGIDLVAMCVDDLVCIGAEPLFLLDYVAVGAVDPDRIAEVVGGVAEGCRQARCALLGGETAEHGGVMGADHLDIAGFAVGVLERGTELGPERVGLGDVLVGLASPGLRSNGYTLARHVLLERAGRSLDDPAWEGATVSVADELLRPSVIYAPAVLDLLAACPGAVHAIATSPAAGSRATSTACCPTTSTPPSTARAWPCRRSSRRSPASAPRRPTRWTACSTWASAWSSSWRPTRSSPSSPASPPRACRRPSSGRPSREPGR